MWRRLPHAVVALVAVTAGALLAARHLEAPWMVDALIAALALLAAALVAHAFTRSLDARVANVLHVAENADASARDLASDDDEFARVARMIIQERAATEQKLAARQAALARLAVEHEQLKTRHAAGEAAMATVKEATQRADVERGRAEARARKFETLIEQSGDAIVVLDRDARIEYANRSFERLTGFPAGETVGETLHLLGVDAEAGAALEEALSTVRQGGVYRGVLAAQSMNGTPFYADTTISPVANADGGNVGFVAILRDATERVRREAEIHYLAKFDALTRLPNRVSLLEHLQGLTRGTRRSSDRNARTAVLYIDLDGFKPINDRFGHHVGDRVLAEAAARLRGQLRAEDMVARVGGDEFVAVLATPTDLEASLRVARKLIDALHAPIGAAGRQLSVNASIGLAMYPDHGTEPFYLIKLADAAMYLAKEQGGGKVAVYRPGLESRAGGAAA